MNIKKVVIVGLENTLTDSSNRQKTCISPTNGGDWHTWHVKLNRDYPTSLVPIVKSLQEDFLIIIL